MPTIPAYAQEELAGPTRSYCTFPGLGYASKLSLMSMLESGKLCTSMSVRLRISNGNSAYRKADELYGEWLLTATVLVRIDIIILEMGHSS